MFQNLLITIFELLFLGILVLVLHRLSPRIGIIPLVFALGVMTTVLQFRSQGLFSVNFVNPPLNLPLGSYILLPVILLGLLAIYVINGSTHARTVIFSIAIAAFVIAISQALLSHYQAVPSLLTFSNIFKDLPLRIPLSSALVLPLDFFILVVVYQAFSNWRETFPSRMAGGIALLTALWFDCILFSVLAYLGTPDFLSQLLPNLLGKSLAGLILLPLAAFYLQKAPQLFPNSAATAPRSLLDLFSTRLQLEARARYHYRLLRTISQINQLILRNDNPQTLLEQACLLLAQTREYSLVWIGLLEEDQETIHLVAKAGSQLDRMEPMLAREGQRPVNKALITGQAQIMKSTGRNLHHSPGLEPTLDTLFSAVAAFPMRHADCAQGILHVMSSQSSIFDNPEEVDLLQELADDLAYALVNLDAHRQQTLLSSAAETMRDGLFITNFRGDLIYANPALADMLGYNRQDLQNKNIASFMTAEQAAKVWKEYYPALRRRGQFTFETEMPGPQGQSIFSFKASLVRGVKGRGAYIVVNVRDVTRRQMYEHRLLTLNQIATELVQIHDPQQLFHAILVASEELLQADASAIYLINGSFSQITEIYPHNLPEGYASNIQLSSMKFSGSMAAILSQATYVEDASTAYLQPEHASLLADNSYHALATLPIYYEEKPLGGLTLYYKQPHHFEQTEKQLGATVASSLAIALQNAYLYQAEHSQRQLAEALAQATAALNSSLNLEEVLDQILEQTIRVVPCRSVNLMLIKDEHAQVVRQLHRSSSNELQNIASGPTVPLTMPTLQRIISSGQSLLIPDTVQDEMWRTLETTNWCRSYAAAPLKIHEEIIGFLNVNSELPNFFNQETTQHLEAFAANAAAALYNARLYQDLQKHTIELEDRVRERTAELSAAKERIEVILTSVPDAVFVLDENDQLLQANQAGEALLAQAGEKQHDLFNPGFLERLRSGNLPDEKAILEIETRAYQALASPLSLQRDQSGLVIVFRDVTRFRELDEMKTRFVSDVSHELRTPLTNLSLYLDLLADERSDQKRQRYQTTLRRETDRLTQLIEDLLTISRMESNRLSMQMQAVDVDHMARDLAEDRASMASQRGLWLSYTAAPNLPSAMADPRLLTQVLSNLLTNALNYTPPNGKIDLSTYCEHTDTGDWVVMAFRDSGVGISPDELPHIFERFYRGSASRQTGAPGTGLGLAICREIMDRMGGRITVQSEPGRGSTFAIWVKAVL